MSEEKKHNSDLYQLFVRNLYESGLLREKREKEGLLVSALRKTVGPINVEEPKMLRMRYLVDDYEEFERIYKAAGTD